MINKKALILVIFAAIIILASFGFPGEISAAYYATGTLISTNLLDGVPVVTSIDGFFASTTIPANTTLSVQFATSSTAGPWYDDSGTLNGTTSIANGTSSTDLSGLGWSGANFYYQIYFTTNNTSTTPVLEEIRLEYTSNTAPAVGSVSFNSGSNIGLTASTTKTITATTTITDNNGWADIASTTGYFYNSTTTWGCSADENTCYIATCDLLATTSNSRDASCTADIWFDAVPTDAGNWAVSTGYNGTIWKAEIKGIDTVDASSTASSTQEINTLAGLEVVETNINYGAIAVGATSTTGKSTTINTTGNCPINANISGVDMATGTHSIAITQQKYGLTDNGWENLTVTASTSVQEINLASGKTDDRTSPASDIVYWGLKIPSSQWADTFTLYSGTNTITVVEDTTDY